MTYKVSAEELLERGAHFGHQSKRWNPKMGQYLYGEEGGVHVFDLIKTKTLLEEALEFLKTSAKEGKSILFVGCKKQAQEKTIEVAEATNSSYFTERWLGGTITNFDQMKKSIKKLSEMKTKMESGEYRLFTKKERLLIDREIARLERYFGGISNLEKVPEILVVVDTHKESSAVKEANSKGVKIVGIVDSNADPEAIDYPIPMNDDAAKAVEYVLDLIKEAIMEGKKGKK